MRSLLQIMLAACLLLLVGCTSRPDKAAGYLPMTELSPDEIAASRSFSFLVDSNGDPILREAAELFAEKLGELTGGGLAVTVSSSVDVSGDFRAGRAQLAFLDSRSADDPEGDLALLSGMMRYQNYEEFTMSLNAQRMRDTLNDRLSGSGLILLAAFYQGSAQMIADRSTVGGELLGDPIPIEYEEEYPDEEIPPLHDELAAVVQTGSAAGPVLEEYGMLVTEAQSLDERAALLAGGGVNVAEFSAAELETLMLPAGMHYLITNHSMTPLWLAVKPAAYSGLPDVYKAAVAEAYSYLFPRIDEYYLGRDARIENRLMMQGILPDDRLDGLRAAALTLREENPPEDPAQKYLLKIVADLS